ncbi:MAG: ABC transporter ATP-binding protein [Candidatus Korarchaeota archaeon]|nr:ABC transporter ATP-binding protein [Candidatus Korarchaeota archaeon]
MPGDNENIILEVKDLKMWFPVRKGLLSKPEYVKAVNNVSFSIKKGETLALVGESGSGKTTLGKTVLRLYEPSEGSIIFDGKDISHLTEKELRWFRKRAQMIYQDPYESLNPYYKVYDILDEVLISNGITDKEERSERILSVLDRVGLTPPSEYIKKYPHMLSGGQRQRVAIARAIILNPDFIVADEPVSMLDASIRAQILYLLREFRESYGITLLYITHDLATTKYFSDRIAVMYAGRLIEVGKTREILGNPFHPYTQALIEAVPDPDPQNRLKLRGTPPGEPPNLINPPPGCPFNPRCPKKLDICEKEVPELIEVSPGRKVACHLYRT